MTTRVATHIVAPALVLLATACAKAMTEPNVAHPEPSSELGPVHTSAVGRAQELVEAADLELRDLADVQAASPDYDRRQAIETQMVAIRFSRDRLQADLGGRDEARLRADSRNLEHVLQAGAATEPQKTSPAPSYEVVP